MMVTLTEMVLLTAVMSQTGDAEIALNSDPERVLQDFENAIGTMADDVIRRYFWNLRCIGVITENSTDYLMQRIPRHLVAYHVTVDSDQLEELLVQVLDDRCAAYLVVVEDSKRMVDLLGDVVRRSTQRVTCRYVILPYGTQPSPTVLGLRVLAYMPDLIEASVLPDGGIVLATHRFAGITTWHDRVQLDVWRNGTWERGADLYPNKFADLGGRRFMISTLHYPPYSVVRKDGTYDGIELTLCEEFGRRHNLTWGVDVDSVDEWGEVYSNFTGNGILGSVVEDRTDVAYAAVFTWYHVYQVLDYTYPYMIVHITCLAPRPRPLGGWLTPVLPFPTAVWQLVGVSVVIGAFLLYSITKLSRKLLRFEQDSAELRYNTFLDCFLHTLGLLVLQAPPIERREGSSFEPTRHLLVWFLIVFILVTSFYSSGLDSVLVVPRYEAPIDTIADLVERGMHWAHTSTAFLYGLEGSTDPTVHKLINLFQAMDQETLHRRSTAGDLAFIVERLQANHYSIGDFIDETSATTLRLMKGNVFLGQAVAAFRKGSPFIEPMNTFIHQLCAAGLFLRWEGEVTRRVQSLRLVMTVQMSNDGPSEYDPPKLGIMHVQGCFALLVLGLGFSFIIFIIELITHYFHVKHSGRGLVSSGNHILNEDQETEGKFGPFKIKLPVIHKDVKKQN